MVMGTIRKYQPKGKKAVVVSTLPQTKKKAVVDNKQLTKKIKQVINKSKENKWVFGYIDNQALTANVYAFNLTSKITEGDGASNRDGDVINLDYVRLNFKFTYSYAGSDGNQYIRIILLRSNNNLADSATFTAGAGNWPCHRTEYQSLIDTTDNNIKVEIDKLVPIKSSDVGVEKVVNLYKKLNYKLRYDDGLTGTTRAKQNLLLIMFVSQAFTTDLEYKVGFKDV